VDVRGMLGFFEGAGVGWGEMRLADIEGESICLLASYCFWYGYSNASRIRGYSKNCVAFVVEWIEVFMHGVLNST
jgi:hypothetical protein